MRFDSARADQITSIVLFVLGAAMLAGGFSMDRLEIRQIHPASIPGLVPMILGGAMMLCAGLLLASVSSAEGTKGSGESVSWRDLGVAAGLSVGYAVVLVGWAPFFLATALYIGAFVTWFWWPRDGRAALQIRVAVIAVGFAAIASAGISALFRYGFLVRLP